MGLGSSGSTLCSTDYTLTIVVSKKMCSNMNETQEYLSPPTAGRHRRKSLRGSVKPVDGLHHP